MKKILLTAIVIAVASIMGVLLFMQWRYGTFVDRTIREYTGLGDLKPETRVRDNGHWYATARLSKQDQDQLLRKYPFSRGFNRGVLRGKYADNGLVDCANCYYYYDDRNGAAYRYLLILIDPQKGDLSVSEVFGG